MFIIACILSMFLFGVGEATATTVHGTVYEWYSFKPLENAIVEVNSTPKQYLVAADAVYSFNLIPGSYLIKASYFEGKNITYTAEEQIKISGEGDYVLDLLLFPTCEEDLLDQKELDELGIGFEKEEILETQKSLYSDAGNVFLLLAGLVVGGIVYFKISKAGKRNSQVSRNERKGPKKVHDRESHDKEKHEWNLAESSFVEKVLVDNNPENNPEKNSKLNLESSSMDLSVNNSKLGSGLHGQGKAPESESQLMIISENSKKCPGVEVCLGVGPSEKTVPDKEISKEKESLGLTSKNEDLAPGSGIKMDPEKEPEDEDRGRCLANEKPLSKNASEASELPQDLIEILELIRANGNRITQKELRKKSKYSESKVSLMLSDLENRGLIEKFKKGRGNILRIPDEQVRKQANQLARAPENSK